MQFQCCKHCKSCSWAYVSIHLQRYYKLVTTTLVCGSTLRPHVCYNLLTDHVSAVITVYFFNRKLNDSTRSALNGFYNILYYSYIKLHYYLNQDNKHYIVNNPSPVYTDIS
uniref:Uncharacterized protein n=1 Tax=Pararge aegeria TaxID=116150 RepID=S4PWL2_9NEOP